jgi:type I restriction enzyme S subunit
MAGKWKNVALGDALTLQRGFDLPAQNRRAGKVPIVSSSGVSDYHAEAMVNGPGVVTGRYGTIGQVFLIKEDFWPLNTTLWVKDFHGNDPHFAAYLLRTVDFQSCSDKSSVPGVNRNDLHRIPIRIPPLPGQKAIARILGALDDKIELNRRMNATLEAMARALFQSWFVDATENGLLDGWREGTLGEVAENPRRVVDANGIKPGTPYIALEHMPRRCIALSEWGTSDALESNKFEFKRGEILFGKLRPYFHKVGVARSMAFAQPIFS